MGHIERGQELDASAIADVGTHMRAQVPRTRSQALPSELPGAEVSREPIGRDSRDSGEEDAPVRGRQVHQDRGRR